MTFKHKLSKRLAMIRDRAVVVIILALFACVGDQPTSMEGSITAPATPTTLFQESFDDASVAARG